MDGNVLLEGENEQTEHRGRRRISSILKASRSPLKTLASGNEVHQDTTIDKRRKSSRRVSFAETIRVFTTELQSAGSVEHEDNGADAKKSEQENEEPTSTMCDITGMETLLHAPIQITGHQNEWGYGVGTGDRTLFFSCENEMDLTASNTVFINNPVERTPKTNVTSFLASLKSQSREDASKDTGRHSSTFFNFPSSQPTTDGSVESKFSDFLDSLKVGKQTSKSRDISPGKENIFPDILPSHLSVENKVSSCGTMFPVAPLHEDAIGDLGQNRDGTFSKAQKLPTNPSSQPKINFSEFLTGLTTGKAPSKCPEGDILKKNQSSHCGEVFSFAPAPDDTGNGTRIFKEQEGMDLTRCHTTAITSFMPASTNESDGRFIEKPPRLPLMDKTRITEDDMDMTCSHTVNIESARSQGQSRVQTLQFNGGHSIPSNKTIIFNDSDVMELTKIHTDPDSSLALPTERRFPFAPLANPKIPSTLPPALLDKTVLFSSDHDMEFTKSHTVPIDFNNPQETAMTNTLKNSRNKRGGLQLSASSTDLFSDLSQSQPKTDGNSDETNIEADLGAKENRVRIFNTFSLHNKTEHLQDSMELTEIGLKERTSVHAEEDDAMCEKTMFFLPDQADMDITRSHTVAIDGKNLCPAVQEKSKVTGKQEFAFESASMSETSTASGGGTRDHELLKRNAALAGTQDYGSSLVRGGTGTDRSSPTAEGMDLTRCHTTAITSFMPASTNESAGRFEKPPRLPLMDKTRITEDDMDMTCSHTVNIESARSQGQSEAPLARETLGKETVMPLSKLKRLSFHNTLSMLSHDKTILFPSDRDDMDLTQSSTVPIETKLLCTNVKANKMHRKSVGAGVYLSSLSDKTVVCVEEMELTKSHTMLIGVKDPAEPAGQDPPKAICASGVQEDLDFLHNRTDGTSSGESKPTCKRKSIIGPLFTCPGDAMAETCAHASTLTSKSETQNENKGLALSHALQDKTLVFSSDADHMDITRSHTVAIENKILGEAMQMYEPNNALNDFIGSFPSVRQNVRRVEEDTETTKSRVVVEDPHGMDRLTSTNKYAERTLCEQDDMELTKSNTVFIDDAVADSSKQGFFSLCKPHRKSVPGIETHRVPRDQTVYIVDDMDITTANAAAFVVVNEPLIVAGNRAAASQDKSVFLFDTDGMDITRSHTVVIEKPTGQVGAGPNDDTVGIKPSTGNKSAFQEDDMVEIKLSSNKSALQEDDMGHRTSSTKILFRENTGLLGPNTHPSDPSGGIEHTGDIASRIVADSTDKASDYKDFDASNGVQKTIAMKEEPEQSVDIQLPLSVDQSVSRCTLTKESHLEDELLVVENFNVREKTASPSSKGSENLSDNNMDCNILPREPTNAPSKDQREDKTDGGPRVGSESESTGTLLRDDVSIAGTRKNRPTSKRVSFVIPEGGVDLYKPEAASGTSVPITMMERGDFTSNLTCVEEEPQKACEKSSSCSDPEFARADQPASPSTEQGNLIPRNFSLSPGSRSANLLPGSRRSAPCTLPGSASVILKGDLTRRSINDLHLKIKSLMQNPNVARGQPAPVSLSERAASSDKGLESKQSPGKEPVVESEPGQADDAISPKAGAFQMERLLPNLLSVKIFQPKLPNRRGSNVGNMPQTPSARETRTQSDRTSLTHLRALTDAEDPQYIDAEILPTCSDGPEPNLSFEVPEGAWEALCEKEKLHEDPDQCLSKTGQKRAREAENQTFHREKRAKQSEDTSDTKGTKDFTSCKSLSDGSSSESSSFQTTKGTEPDSCSSCSMDSRVELSQACSQMESQSQWETECEKSLWQKLQDGTITVKEFFALLRIRILIQKPRYSELPANRRANEDQNPLDALIDHHIFQPKLQVYEEECHALHQVIEELRTNTEMQDKPLAALNSVLWEAMSMCSEEEVMCFGVKLKSMKALYAKKCKLISHKGKVSMYSKLLLNAEDNRKQLRSTISDIDKLLDEVADTISDLESETAKLKAECQSGLLTHKDPSVAAIQAEYENMKIQEVNGSRKISELEDRKHQLLTRIGDLQEKARGQPDVPEEYNYTEWDLEKWTDEQAIFNFLYNSLELAVLFGDPVDGVTFNDAPCRRISGIQFSTMLDDDAAPPSTLLVHRLISQFVVQQGGLLEDCKTQQDLPRLLFDVSLVVSRCKLLGEEIEFLMKWGARYNVLKTEIHNTKVKLLFSSMATLSKFELVVNVTESYPMLPFSFTFHNFIGQVHRAALAAVLSKVPVGRSYLKRCVIEIHKDLLS